MALQMDKIVQLSVASPAEAPLAMPPQRLSQKHQGITYWQDWTAVFARLITFGGAIGISTYATYQMILIVSQGQVSAMQWLLAGLFSITFVWIAFAACSALAGFLLARPEPDLSKSQTEDWKRTRTALLMPVYNEDPC
ncbi:MAG: glucan biosynthesis glucosyltransferase H, partial [Pseudomonadota bacterium]